MNIEQIDSAPCAATCKVLQWRRDILDAAAKDVDHLTEVVKILQDQRSIDAEGHLEGLQSIKEGGEDLVEVANQIGEFAVQHCPVAQRKLLARVAAYFSSTGCQNPFMSDEKIAELPEFFDASDIVNTLKDEQE